MKRLIIPAVALLGLAACGGGGGQELSGTFTLIDSDIAGDWQSCSGTGGYDDFGPGMDVTVRDGENEIIATGTTENLSSTEDADSEWASGDASYFCTVKFSIDSLPRAEFYSIEVGHRGDLSYSRDELAEADWNVELSLGSVEDALG